MRLILIFTISLLLGFSNYSYGQKKVKKITITGRVTDANNKPVVAAAIFIDKIKTGQSTDINGNYKVKVKSDATEILVFTLLSGTKEELIDNRTEINIQLKGDSSAGPDSPDKKGDESPKQVKKEADKNNDLRSPGTIDVKSSNVPVYQNIYDMIRGRVPGVEVSDRSIKIRGTNSLNISTEPLFVVDGVIVNSIDDIAPETVKSIEVLKGPDASIYGTRGSNGVIVITRRTGKE